MHISEGLAYATPFGLFIAGLWMLLVLKRAYITPLRAVPGPWYARLTHLWLKIQVLRGRRMHYIHDLHKKYGPFVRIAPQEIDVSDPGAFREIHQVGSGYLKSPWYSTLRAGKFNDILTIIPPRQHAQRRRLFAQSFSVTSLRTNWECHIVEKVKLAVENIKRDAQIGDADIYKWWTCMTTDVISHLSFGEPLDMLINYERKEFKDIEAAPQLGAKRAELPFLYAVWKFLIFPFAKHSLSAEEKGNKYGKEAVAKARVDSLSRINIFGKIVGESEKDVGGLTEEEVGHEAGGFIVAGSGTTAVTLTYLVWAVLSNPKIQTRLEQEVSELPEEFNDAELDRLPFLNATIDETLRLFGAAPGSLPRSVPQGGAKLGGYYIPEGVTVSTQAYTIHRNPDIYPSPERFDPSRFCTSPNEYTPSKIAFAPFGGGSRICLGLHLARMELRHGAAYFFRECKGAKLSSSTTRKSMEMVNYFLIAPAAKRCNVTLL